MAGRRALQPNRPLAPRRQMIKRGAAHGAQPDDSDVEHRHHSGPRLQHHDGNLAATSVEFKTIMEKAGTIPTSSTVDEFTALIASTAKEAEVMFRELDIPQLD